MFAETLRFIVIFEIESDQFGEFCSLLISYDLKLNKIKYSHKFFFVEHRSNNNF